MKYPVCVPIIGSWLYRHSVKKLTERAQQGDGAAVRNLIDIFCTSHHEPARNIAHTALQNLTSPPAIDSLCRVALERNNAELFGIATNKNYLPCDPKMQALFLFITGQRQRYELCDPLPNRPLLASGYAEATNREKCYIRDTAKKNGQIITLAAALKGTGLTRNNLSWSEEEWEIVITGLIQERDWEGLWHQVIHAPLNQTITALSAMKGAEWKPIGDDRALFEEIARNLPEEWCFPIPQNTTYAPSWNPDCQPLYLSFSEDGALLAAGCVDGTVCLWNTHSGTLLFRLPAGFGTVTGISISPDKTHLLCAGATGTLQCRDTVTGSLLWSVLSKERTPLRFTCLHKGRAVVFQTFRGHLQIVNMTDGQVHDISGGYEVPVTSSEISRNDRFCATGHSDGTVGIWDLQKRQFLHTLENTGDAVRSLTFFESDNEILVIYDRILPVMWNIALKIRIRTYKGNTGTLCSRAISPDGGSFAIVGDDRILRIWRSGKCDPVTEIPLYNHPFITCSISNEGKMLTVGCKDGTFRTYALDEGAVLYEKKAHKQAITAIALTKNAERIASTSWDGTVKLWDCISGELIRTLLQPAGEVTGIAATPDGSSVYAAYMDGTVRENLCGTCEFNRVLAMYTSTIRAIAINPEGTLLACAGGDSTLRIWNIETGGLVTEIERLTKTQRCLAFSPDGRTLISGGWDGKVRLWSIPGGNLLKTYIGHTSIITTLAITPDGTLLATGSNDRSVRLWTIEDSTCISVKVDSRSEISALALSPDGALLAFAGGDAVIHICHLPDGTPAPAIPALPGKITALVFASQGRLLVAGLDTGTVAVFSCAGQYLLQTLTAHTGAVTGIAVLPWGESILTSGLDGQVRYGNLPWTRSLSGTTLDDIPLVARYERTCARSEAQAQWAFLNSMLATRFTNDIELCTTVNDSGLFDIQIVG